jgi:two-component system, response regulator
LAARDTGLMPGVVVLDLKLPKLDGLEVLPRLRGHALAESLPVGILTSSRAEQDIAMRYDLQAQRPVRKLVDLLPICRGREGLGPVLGGYEPTAAAHVRLP